MCKDPKLFWRGRNSVKLDRNANRDLHHEAKNSPLGYRVNSVRWNFETENVCVIIKNPSVEFLWCTTDYTCIPTMDARSLWQFHSRAICKDPKLLWSDRNSVELDRNVNGDLHHVGQLPKILTPFRWYHFLSASSLIISVSARTSDRSHREAMQVGGGALNRPGVFVMDFNFCVKCFD